MMLIDTKYALGQTVYLTTDTDQSRRLITAIILRSGSVVYELSCSTTSSNHYDFEISEEENIEMKIK